MYQLTEFSHQNHEVDTTITLTVCKNLWQKELNRPKFTHQVSDDNKIEPFVILNVPDFYAQKYLEGERVELLKESRAIAQSGSVRDVTPSLQRSKSSVFLLIPNSNS